MRNLTKAITSLYPTAIWQLDGDDYSGLVWMSEDIQKPTEAELEAEDARLQAEYQAKQYQRDRALEYPPLAEQLDLLYHDRINNTDTWMETIQAVKTKYPKS